MRPKYETKISQTTKRIVQIICAVCCLVLILQIGCQEQSKPAEKLTAARTEPGENMEEIEIAPKPTGPAPKIVISAKSAPVQNKQVSSNSQIKGRSC